jgi:hypothetical protein
MRISGPLASSTIVAMHFGVSPAMAAVTASKREARADRDRFGLR